MVDCILHKQCDQNKDKNSEKEFQICEYQLLSEMTVFVRRDSHSKISKDNKKQQASSTNSCRGICDFLLKNKIITLLILTVCLMFYYLLRSKCDTDALLRKNYKDAGELFVHYVWIENRVSAVPYDLKVLHYASVVSAIKQLSPVTIYLHTNAKFTGPYWDAVKHYITIVPIQRIVAANGRKLIAIEQEADLFKLKAAAKYGGFLADFDIYFVGERTQLVNWLRRYDCVFGKTFWKGRAFISSGGFACRSNTDFIKEWLHEYEYNYRGYCGKNPIAAMYNACVYPMKLYSENATYRKTIHFADEGMYTYYGQEGAEFRHGHVKNWKRHFYIHTDDDYETHELTYSELFDRESSFGQMFRNIVSPALPAVQIAFSCQFQVPPTGFYVHYVLNPERRKFDLNDLTNSDYISLYSILKNVGPQYLVIHSLASRVLNGPLIIHLTKMYPEVQFQVCFSSTQDRNTLMKWQESTQTFVVPSGTYFLRKLTRERFDDPSGPGTKKTPLSLSTNEVLKKTQVLSFFKDADVVSVNINSTNTVDLAFTTVRDSPTLLGQIYRLVLYGSPNMVKEGREVTFSCNFD